MCVYIYIYIYIHIHIICVCLGGSWVVTYKFGAKVRPLCYTVGRKCYAYICSHTALYAKGVLARANHYSKKIH